MANSARRLALVALGAAAAAGLAPSAVAGPEWMSEAAMRAAFIGKTLDGHYVYGAGWTETYTADGRLDYRESVRKGVGYWLFRGRAFCTFYDPGQGLAGGCFAVLQPSGNCFEFYFAGVNEREADRELSGESAPGPLGSWVARGWRKGEPSTCESKPIARRGEERRAADRVG
jgi:hypothetical protein